MKMVKQYGFSDKSFSQSECCSMNHWTFSFLFITTSQCRVSHCKDECAIKSADYAGYAFVDSAVLPVQNEWTFPKSEMISRIRNQLWIYVRIFDATNRLFAMRVLPAKHCPASIDFLNIAKQWRFSRISSRNSNFIFTGMLCFQNFNFAHCFFLFDWYVYIISKSIEKVNQKSCNQENRLQLCVPNL